MTSIETDRMHDYRRWQAWLRRSELRLRTRWTEPNRVSLHSGAAEFAPRMLRAIDASRRSVTFQFFNIEADEVGTTFAEALIRARGRGVVVQVVLDSVEMFLETNGRWAFLPLQPRHVRRERRETRRMVQRMRAAGIDIHAHGWRYRWNRHHAKSLVVDGHTAFVTGFNPTAHNFEWRDVCLEVTGAAAADIQRRFLDVFADSGLDGALPGPLAATQPMQPGLEMQVAVVAQRPNRGDRYVKRLILDVMAQARSSLWIENAYVSHPEVFAALVEARRRGVPDVHLIVPERSNHASVDRALRRNQQRLIDEGVTVSLVPHMTHAKVLVADAMLVCVGSCNLDRFALDLQNELNLVAIDPAGALARQLRDSRPPANAPTVPTS